MNFVRGPLLALGLVSVLLLGAALYFHFPSHKLALGVTNGRSTVEKSTVPNVSSMSSQFQPNTVTDLSYRYNAQGQIQAILYPNGSAYTYMYNANGDKIRETSPTGRTWMYTYDQSHHPLTVMNPDGHFTSYKVPSSQPNSQ